MLSKEERRKAPKPLECQEFSVLSVGIASMGNMNKNSRCIIQGK